MDIQQEIAKLIREQRQEKGWSTMKLANAAGVSSRIISYWERGERLPRDITTIDNVLRELGVSITIGETR